jgi:hypothetical protein
LNCFSIKWTRRRSAARQIILKVNCLQKALGKSDLDSVLSVCSDHLDVAVVCFKVECSVSVSRVALSWLSSRII